MIRDIIKFQMKKLLQKISVKGIFNTIFPKAENSKIGRFAGGLINGATGGSGEVLKSFILTMFDTNKDGVVNIEDFKGMTAKSYGFAIGVLILVFLGLYLLQ